MAAAWSDPYFQKGDKVKLLVALSIADYAREDGKAWPAIETIAKRSRTSVRGAQEAVREMERDNKMSVAVGQGPRGTNVYSLLFTPAQPAPRTACTPQTSGGKSAGISAGKSGAGLHPIHKEPPISVRNGKEPPPRRNRGARAPLECEAFKEFWTAYPRKKSIADAEKAWVENDCAKHLPQILATVRALKSSRDWLKDNGQFIPYPASWLNRRGWEDEAMPFHASRGLNEDINPKVYS